MTIESVFLFTTYLTVSRSYRPATKNEIVSDIILKQSNYKMDGKRKMRRFYHTRLLAIYINLVEKKFKPMYLVFKLEHLCLNYERLLKSCRKSLKVLIYKTLLR